MWNIFSRTKSLWTEKPICTFTRTLLYGTHGNFSPKTRVQKQVPSEASTPFTISGRNMSNDDAKGKQFNPLTESGTPRKNMVTLTNTVKETPYSIRSLASKVTSSLRGKDKLVSELNIYDMESIKKNAKGFKNDAEKLGMKVVSVVHEYDNKLKNQTKKSAKGLSDKLLLVYQKYDTSVIRQNLKEYNQVYTENMRNSLYNYKQEAHQTVLGMGNKAKIYRSQLDTTLKKNLNESMNTINESIAQTKVKAKTYGSQLDTTLKKNLNESITFTKVKTKEQTDNLGRIYELYKKETFQETLNNLKNGARADAKDLRKYIKVWAYKVNGMTVKDQSCSYFDLMAHSRFKRNSRKTLSLFLFPFVPKVGFYMLALPIITPRVMLTENAWSEHQKVMYRKYNHFARTQSFKELMNFMQNHSQEWSHEGKDVVEKVAQSLVDKHVFLTNEELQIYKTVCRHESFSLEEANSQLIQCLCQVHKLSTFGTVEMQRSRLHSMAVDILEMDYKLRRMNLKRLSPEDITAATYLRGLDSASLSHDAQLFWLQNWLHLTETCSRTNDSFILQASMIQSMNYDEQLYRSLLNE